MKRLVYALGCLLVLCNSSCKDWLDVNVDPDSPNNETVIVSNRLVWIEKFFMYTAGVTNMRTSCQAGLYYSKNSNNNKLSVTWACAAGSTTTPYQSWFVETASNLNDLYDKAEEEGAYHYMAVADVFHAMGFMEMLDLYGEIPYTDALGSSPTPTYDDGKTIFYGCIDKLDEAIELFNTEQESTATSLSEGDFWNNGDVDKWLKLCYGLKARYLLRLSKKSDLFDMDAILTYANQGPQSNSDNTLVPCYNSESDVTDYLMGDPVMTNSNWDVAAYNSNQRISQYFYNLLTNMRDSHVTDPRMSKIVPAIMCNVQLDESGNVSSYEWNRSIGVDVFGDAERLLAGGETSITNTTYATEDTEIDYTFDDSADRTAFIDSLDKYNRPYVLDGDNVIVTYPAGAHYINSDDPVYAGDTVYVNLRSYSTLTGGLDEMDMNWYASTAAQSAGVVGGTGSFQVRPNSDFEIITYHEMCFIKAEIYMRQGNTSSAYTAYLEGIEAHIDMMQEKLTEWEGAGYAEINPDMGPMDTEAISDYMASDAVCQSASELTMSDIMLQKYVAMGCSVENWNDMRRFNYSVGDIEDFGVVYPGYQRSPLFAGASQITGTTPTDPTYWMRRWRLPATLELSYNETNALAINKRALDDDIWCIPIWWDCETDDEYYNYIN